MEVLPQFISIMSQQDACRLLEQLVAAFDFKDTEKLSQTESKDRCFIVHCSSPSFAWELPGFFKKKKSLNLGNSVHYSHNVNNPLNCSYLGSSG